jgi:SAM-dependent methyltransferase
VDHADHVGLLRAALADAAAGERWADIGAGTGAFTLAMADLLGAGAAIIALDRDASALEANARTMAARFPAVRLEMIVADLTDPPDLSPLDGLVAANSLHFVTRAHQIAAARRLAALVRPGGRFVVVEYDADRGNPWVPNPFSFETWRGMAVAAGLGDTTHLGRVPSRFLGAIYAAASRVRAGEA